MMSLSLRTLTVLGLLWGATCWTGIAQAATNSATDPGSGGVTLTNSGNVTVNSAALALRKLVYSTGGTCLASSNSGADCGSTSTVTVPANTTVNFLIYVDNTTAVQASDIQIRDLLDETATGFTYVDNSLTWNNNTTATGATIATIYTDAAGTTLTDLESVADIASAVDTGASPAGKDKITVGDTAGTNAQANITALKVFALRFQAIKK